MRQFKKLRSLLLLRSLHPKMIRKFLQFFFWVKALSELMKKPLWMTELVILQKNLMMRMKNKLKTILFIVIPKWREYTKIFLTWKLTRFHLMSVLETSENKFWMKYPFSTRLWLPSLTRLPISRTIEIALMWTSLFK